MTNAEKYEEVFGLKVDPSLCPTFACTDCPCGIMDHNNGDVTCHGGCTYEWWNKEYKGVNNG